MGAAGRERVERHFSAHVNYRRVLSKIKECVATFRQALPSRRDFRAEVRPRRDPGLTPGERAWASES
jgi:hypothetical protein